MDDECGVDDELGHVDDVDVLLDVGVDVGEYDDVLIECLRTSAYLGVLVFLLTLLLSMPSSSLAMLAFTPGELALEGVGYLLLLLLLQQQQEQEQEQEQ